MSKKIIKGDTPEGRPLPTDDEVRRTPNLWATMAGRLLWAKARLEYPATWAQISEKCEFTDRMQAAETVRRLIYTPGFDKRVSTGVIDQLAHGLGVNATWARTGLLGPDTPDMSVEYPEAVSRLLERNPRRWTGTVVHNAVVHAMLTMPEDLTPGGWSEYLDHAQRDIENRRNRRRLA